MEASDTLQKQGVDQEAWKLLAGLVYPPPLLGIARDAGLSPGALGAIARLEQPLSMGRIAELLHCDPSNVTAIADSLEARGLAERRPAAADRRVKEIALTAKGRRMRGRVVGALSEPPAWLRGLSAADQRALRDLLRRARPEAG